MTDLLDNPNMEAPETAEPLRRAIGERYLTYALSTIMHRALPDVRDGLKPVHRRILYAMRELRLTSSGGFRKSAKISGDVMGNFHPHGDGAIYDAMARLAQEFNVRYPLVDGQGNFGNVDGDNPAASRYTEARLTAAAEALLEGLNEDAVDFRENYDGTLTEPVVLPAAFPNLLANGASGIAVGMATNIPPHNLEELLQACIHLAKNNNSEKVRDATILEKVRGPDFPTGGVIVEPPESIAQAYRTGRGGFRVRARWKLEELGRGQWQIVVTEIPYQVQKSKLIERIAELIQTRKAPILADVRDESAEDIRVILEPKSRSVDPEVLMGILFRNTDLEIRFPLNMNALIDGRTPKVCSLKEVLRAFLDHRRDVLWRRSTHRLGKIAARVEMIEGFLIAFMNLDRAIEIIRYDDDPKTALMYENWPTKPQVVKRATSEKDYESPLDGVDLENIAPVPDKSARDSDEAPRRFPERQLSDVQADAILNMRLRSLRRLEEKELKSERGKLKKERAGLKEMLADDKKQWKRVAEELGETRKAFGKNDPGWARRTGFGEAAEIPDVPLEALIEREPVTVVCSKMGWIRAMKGHIAPETALKYRDGDEKRFVLHAETTDRALLFGSNGRFYTLPISNLPGGRSMGEPVRLMIDLPNEIDIVALLIHAPGRKLLVASSVGDGFVVPEDEVVAHTRVGKQVLNLKDSARGQVCKPVVGDHVAVVSRNRKFLAFPISELPEMSRGKGIRLQTYKKSGNDGLSDAATFSLSEGLSWRLGEGRIRTESELNDWIGNRADIGRMPPHGFPRNNRFT